MKHETNEAYLTARWEELCAMLLRLNPFSRAVTMRLAEERRASGEQTEEEIAAFVAGHDKLLDDVNERQGNEEGVAQLYGTANSFNNDALQTLAKIAMLRKLGVGSPTTELQAVQELLTAQCFESLGHEICDCADCQKTRAAAPVPPAPTTETDVTAAP